MDIGNINDPGLWVAIAGVVLTVLILTTSAMLPEECFWSSWLELGGVLSFYTTHAGLRFCQILWWRLNGVNAHLKWSETDSGYERCVQVRSVIARQRFPKVNHPRPWDFTSVHKSFAHPRVLLSEHVTVYCVTPTHAHLVETPADVDVYSSKLSPFMKRTQFRYAVKVLIVPIKHFHRLCSEIGDPKVPITWINNTGRCGSTLLTQILETIPRMRCLSEPDVTTTIAVLSRSGQISASETEEITRTCIRHLCRSSPQVDRIAVKVRYTYITEIRLVQRLFPDIKHMFLYRDLGPVMKSFYKFTHRDLAVRMLENVINKPSLRLMRPQVEAYLTGLIAWNDEAFDKQALLALLSDTTFMGYSTAIICSNLAVFKWDLESGAIRDVPTLHYDELTRRPLEVTTRLFEALAIPVDFAGPAQRAFENDSQAGDYTSNIGNKDHKNVRPITAEDIKSMNLTLKAMGLPDMTEALKLPGAIEASDKS